MVVFLNSADCRLGAGFKLLVLDQSGVRGMPSWTDFDSPMAGVKGRGVGPFPLPYNETFSICPPDP
jgi:hypothetical protein